MLASLPACIATSLTCYFFILDFDARDIKNARLNQPSCGESAQYRKEPED